MKMINVDTDMVNSQAISSKPSSARDSASACSPSCATRTTAAKTRISCSTNRPIAKPRSWWPAIISAAARRASMRPGPLMDFGIRCVISTSFGDIFLQQLFQERRCCRSGSRRKTSKKLFDDADRGANATLFDRSREAGNPRSRRRHDQFEIDEHRKHCMLNGLDDIGLTKQKQSKIVSYEQKGPGRAAVGVIFGVTRPDARLSPACARSPTMTSA